MKPIHRLSASLYRYSSWRSLLTVTIVYGFFIASVMPAQSQQSQRYAGDWGAPDRHFFYTPEALYKALDNWDEAGQQEYIEFRLTLDILWALAYTGFLVFSISCLLRYAGRISTINTLPILALAADYTENFLGILLVSLLPRQIDWLAWVAATITATKWSALGLAHLVLLGALILALRRRASTHRP